MTILNLTIHDATPEQKAAGVREPVNKSMVKELLLFTSLPERYEISRRAVALANVVKKFENFEGKVMIGGAPYLLPVLEYTLSEIANCTPVYAYTDRESVEEPQPDGTVIKKTVFRHKGFVTGLGNWRVK